MSELIYLSVERLHPHPDNPRKDLGDLTELADSIKANGVLQNLTVVPLSDVDPDATVDVGDNHYTVIIGHRRLAAAKLAGLIEVPCVVTTMTDKEQIQTTLLENMQRSNLSPREEAQGFQMMLDLGSTVKEIAEKAGFSKTTIRSRLKLLELDPDKFRKSEARGATMQDYQELDKIDDPELKNKALDAIGTANFRDTLKKAIEDDKFKKCLAKWEADVSAFATKIEKRGYVGDTEVPMEYFKNYHRWNQSVEVYLPDDVETVKYYYTASDTDIYVYRECQEQEGHEETEEERHRRERKEQSERVWAELKEITKRHFALRSEFISNFGAAKKNAVPIMKFAIGEIIGDGRYRLNEVNGELLAELLDLDVDDNTAYSELENMVELISDKTPEYVLLACTYAHYDEDGYGYWNWQWQDGAYHFSHTTNDKLDHLYDFLTSIGYEMSDEEKAMQDGTHDLLREGGSNAEDVSN